MKRLIALAMLCAACGSTNSPTTPTPQPVATATRIISLSGPIAFGDVQVGSSKAMTLIVSNTGNTSFGITGATGGFPGLSLGTFTGVVAGGGTFPLAFTFAPTTTGARSAIFTVSGDFTSGNNATTISGNGTAAPPPSAAGTWIGRTSASTCRQSGPLGGTDYCHDNANIFGPLTMTFAQSVTGAVAGTVNFIDYRANVSGSLNDTRLQVNGTGNAGFLDYEYANWNTVISGNTMTGTFLFRFSAKNPGGFVEWTMTLANVIRQ